MFKRKCSDEERLFDNTDATFDPDQAVAEIVPSLVLLDENDDEVVGIKPQIDVEKHHDDHRVTSISAKPHLKSNTDDQGTNNNQSQQHTGRLSSDKDSEASSRTVANNWSSGSSEVSRGPLMLRHPPSTAPTSLLSAPPIGVAVCTDPASSGSNSTSISRVSSVGDLPNQTGNTGRHETSGPVYKELTAPGQLPSESYSKETWEVNYREAAIFLDEGKNNDKFLHHPRNKEALPAYLMVHSRWFDAIDFMGSFIILILGLFEKPCVPWMRVDEHIHGSIELCSLVLLSLQMVLKTRWIGLRSCLKHKRTLIKGSSLIIMIVEALTVIVRHENHFRVTRALRPLFLLDTSVCGGVRRFIRQVLQSLPPIIDMMGLLLFIMLIYSVLGFYLFGPTEFSTGSPYFSTFTDSFINLFVLLTTANYPDVMMPSYESNPLSAIFFISYLSINLYFLMNLMLAVVYDSFTRIEVGKFKKLFLHKRKACQHAFKLLVTKDNTEGVSFANFSGLISHFSPRSSTLDHLLIFKTMRSDPAKTYLTLQDFYKVYDSVQYRWSLSDTRVPYYEGCKMPFRIICDATRSLVKSKGFEFCIYLLIMTNGVLLVVQTYFLHSTTDTQDIYAPWANYIFVGAYTIEVMLKLLGLGFQEYFKSLWNIFDFMVTLAGIISIVLTELNIPTYYIIILRPLRLLRLFKMKKRFRDVFGTFVILLPRLNCAAIVLIFVYYFYGIIGLELFHRVQLRNCCKNTTVEPYYNYNDNSSGIGYYYLNNFESLPAAGVTLFELTVVNNWFIIMEGFAHTTTPWSRIYFMSFYLFTMVVMTIVVAFILEAFLFRIQYKKTMNKEEEVKTLSVNMQIDREELFMLDQLLLGDRGFRDHLKNDFQGDTLEFTGYKRRTKEELQKLMYRKETDEWLAEAEREERRRAEEFDQAVLTSLTSSNINPEQRIQLNDSDSDDLMLTRQIIS